MNPATSRTGRPGCSGPIRAPRGAALLGLLVVLVMLASAALLVLPTAPEATPAGRELDELRRARDLLVARALATWDQEQNRPESRPGALRCPDLDGDGSADLVGCNRRSLGRFPWRSLRAGRPLLGRDGQALWYAATPALTDRGGRAHRVNSDSPDLPRAGGWLRLDGRPVAAVLIAPGAALPQQAGRAVSSAEPGLFLEGANADGDLLFRRDQGNDRVLAVGPEEILPRLEQQVLSAVARALLEHQRAPGCGKLPWPAPDGAEDSQAGLGLGRIPTGRVVAPGRPAACPARLRLPTWIAANDWHRLLVYARAEGGLGCRHDGTCLGLRRGPSQVVQAPAVLLLGGRALNALGQRRPGRGSADYFEGDNADLRPPFEQREAGPTFNDRLLALPPGPG